MSLPRFAGWVLPLLPIAKTLRLIGRLLQGISTVLEGLFD